MELDKQEQHNLEQIQDLNQRGGRMLSMVDLLTAGTVDCRLAAFFMLTQRADMSFLTAANPSGTGKTTLMGALLNLLKPGIEIRTLTGRENISELRPGQKGRRYLVHELGTGPYYSYLWGQEAANFFHLGERGSLASCLHADTLPELKQDILGPDLNINEETLHHVDLIVFMKKYGSGFKVRRRVTEVYGLCSRDGEYRLLYDRPKEREALVETEFGEQFLAREVTPRTGAGLNDIKNFLARGTDFWDKMKAEGASKLPGVRTRVLEFYKNEDT